MRLDQKESKTYKTISRLKIVIFFFSFALILSSSLALALALSLSLSFSLDARVYCVSAMQQQTHVYLFWCQCIFESSYFNRICIEIAHLTDWATCHHLNTSNRSDADHFTWRCIRCWESRLRVHSHTSPHKWLIRWHF